MVTLYFKVQLSPLTMVFDTINYSIHCALFARGHIFVYTFIYYFYLDFFDLIAFNQSVITGPSGEKVLL